METLEVINQHNNETSIASESGHWYDKQGNAVYEVEAKKGGMRATTLADARKLGLVPSVTNILNIAAKPGLEAWKAKQILEASLTLPRIAEESLDDYAVRVMEDAKAQSKKAMERGTQLHAAIEKSVHELRWDAQWESHIKAVRNTLGQLSIHLEDGRAEHSFSCDLGFGGKVDFHSDNVLIDFKTKDRIVDKKQLSWPEQCWQLSAYAYGLHMLNAKCRILNVFIGVEDCQVRIHEWTTEDAMTGWEVFNHLLAVWKIIKKYNP